MNAAVENPNNSKSPMSRKNSRKANRKDSRKNSRKQRGGDGSGIFHSRIAGPAAFIIRRANDLVGTEVAAARRVIGGVFDGVADAVNGLGHGANNAVRGISKVVSRKNRRNNRKH